MDAFWKRVITERSGRGKDCAKNEEVVSENQREDRTLD